jgi:hypothetical protein
LAIAIEHPTNRDGPVKKGDNEIVTIRDCLDVQDKWLELIHDTINDLQTAREAEV